VAAAVKVIPFTSVFAEIETSVVFERANVAVSDDPSGTVAGVQFVLVFQSPERALRFHVALLPLLAWTQSIKISALTIAVTWRSGVFISEPENGDNRPPMSRLILPIAEQR